MGHLNWFDSHVHYDQLLLRMIHLKAAAPTLTPTPNEDWPIFKPVDPQLAPELLTMAAAFWQHCLAQGVMGQIIPAIHPHNWAFIASLSHHLPHTYFSLGVHPYVAAQVDATSKALNHLQQTMTQLMMLHPHCIAIGECGLDGSQKGLALCPMPMQLDMLNWQLKLARDLDMPVILHAVKTIDPLLALLRRYDIRKGVFHAFNGSVAQAVAIQKQGLNIGVGSVISYPNSKKMQRWVTELDLALFLLETDAPDFLPQWLNRHPHEATQLYSSKDLPQLANLLLAYQQQDVTLPELHQHLHRNLQLLFPQIKM